MKILTESIPVTNENYQSSYSFFFLKKKFDFDPALNFFKFEKQNAEKSCDLDGVCLYVYTILELHSTT